MPGSLPDRGALARRVASVNQFMSVHRGGLALVDVDDEGLVEVEYRGMCTGCTYRPICSETTVRPALLALEGVSSVAIRGGGVNTENRLRLARSLAGSHISGSETS